MKTLSTQRLALTVAALALAIGVGAPGPAQEAATQAKSNLDYWLSQGKAASSGPAGVVEPTANPLGPAGRRIGRRDALPGVVALSDGRLLPGYVYTTRDKNWEMWVESEKRWRHIPPILVLSIRAVVLEAKLDKEWRWKEMGSDERTYTGRTRPVRRHEWTFHLIDGSYLTGSVKGQPLWVEYGPKKHGPFVLHERTAGQYGQALADLVYVKKVVISRRAMSDALDDRAPATKPATPAP